MNSNECWHPVAFLVLAADHSAGSLGRDHNNINGCRRHDLAEVDIEPMREHKTLVLFEMGENLIFINSSLVFIRNEDLDDIGPFDRIGNLHNLHAILRCSIPALAGPETDHNIKPAVS